MALGEIICALPGEYAFAADMASWSSGATTIITVGVALPVQDETRRSRWTTNATAVAAPSDTTAFLQGNSWLRDDISSMAA